MRVLLWTLLHILAWNSLSITVVFSAIQYLKFCTWSTRVCVNEGIQAWYQVNYGPKILLSDHNVYCQSMLFLADLRSWKLTWKCKNMEPRSSGTLLQNVCFIDILLVCFALTNTWLKQATLFFCYVRCMFLFVCKGEPETLFICVMNLCSSQVTYTLIFTHCSKSIQIDLVVADIYAFLRLRYKIDRKL